MLKNLSKNFLFGQLHRQLHACKLVPCMYCTLVPAAETGFSVSGITQPHCTRKCTLSWHLDFQDFQLLSTKYTHDRLRGILNLCSTNRKCKHCVLYTHLYVIIIKTIKYLTVCSEVRFIKHAASLHTDTGNYSQTETDTCIVSALDEH